MGTVLAGWSGTSFLSGTEIWRSEAVWKPSKKATQKKEGEAVAGNKLGVSEEEPERGKVATEWAKQAGVRGGPYSKDFGFYWAYCRILRREAMWSDFLFLKISPVWRRNHRHAKEEAEDSLGGSGHPENGMVDYTRVVMLRRWGEVDFELYFKGSVDRAG